MTEGADRLAELDALSDEEYDRRFAEAVDDAMHRMENALRSDDPVEQQLLNAATPLAMRNILAGFVAAECVGQPRPYRLVKQMLSDLAIEQLALAFLKEMEAQGFDPTLPPED